MVPNDSKCFLMVPSGSQWLPVVLNGYQWFPVILNGYQCFPEVLNGYQWCPMVPNASEWFSMVSSSSQWNMAREETLKTQDRFGVIAFEGNIDTGNGCMNAIKQHWGQSMIPQIRCCDMTFVLNSRKFYM